MAGTDVGVGLAAIVVLGVGVQWLAWRLHVPSILLLLLAGFLAGAVTGVLEPDALFGDALLPIVSLAVGIILFEGGLGLRFSEIRGHGPVVTRLLTVGALATWVLATGAAYMLAGLSLDLAALVGAILVVTGPTVVGPLLHHVRPKGEAGAVVKWEGILIDPVGALLAVLVFETVSAGSVEQATSAVGAIVIRALLAGGAVGLIAAGIVYVVIKRRWVPHHLQSPVTLALVLGAFVVSDLLQTESGLLAVTVMGIALANQEKVQVAHIVEFKENLRVLLLAGLFVVLAARLRYDDLRGLGWGALAFIAALLLVVRPVTALLSTSGSRLSWRQRAFVAWMAPRGIVAAAVASLFALRLEELGHPQAGEVVPLVFLVIVATVTVYGLTAYPVARALGIAGPPPQGVLFVGANRIARELAREVQRLGHRVLLVDTNPSNVLAAAGDALPVAAGNAISDEFLHDFDPDGLGRVLSLTPNDEVNQLATLTFAEWFSRDEVYQLPPRSASEKGEAMSPSKSHLYGRILFGLDATYAQFDARLAAGDGVHALRVQDRVDPATLAGPSGKPAMPLMMATENGALRISTVNAPVVARPGTMLVYLGGPPPARGSAKPPRPRMGPAASAP